MYGLGEYQSWGSELTSCGDFRGSYQMKWWGLRAGLREEFRAKSAV
jgi:hypothetical protein